MNDHDFNLHYDDDDDPILSQALKEIAEEEITNMDIWLNTELPIKPPQSTWKNSLDSVGNLADRVMKFPSGRRDSSNLTFWVAVAALILAMVIIIPYVSQPDNSLSVLPAATEQQPDHEVDCLADHAYRVVYPDELANLTTADLKCAFIVGDLRGIDISHLDFSDTVMRDVNLSGMDLQRMKFNRTVLINADLSEANLSGAKLNSANLANANLALANLTNADLVKANLSEATLIGADLSGAYMARANLRGADLSCADGVVSEVEATPTTDETHANECRNPTVVSQANLSYATLIEANFTYADLRNTSLSFATLDLADFSYSNMSNTDLRNSSLGKTHLTGANLTNARFDLADMKAAQLTGADLTGASLTWVYMSGTFLQNANLKGADMRWIVLQEGRAQAANFSDVTMTESQLESAFLSGSDFSGSDLSHSNFQDANLANTNLSNTNLSDTDLRGANLVSSNLTGADLTNSVVTNVTWTDVTLPDGTTWIEGTDLTRFTDPNNADYWRSDDPDSPAFAGEG